MGDIFQTLIVIGVIIVILVNKFIKASKEVDKEQSKTNAPTTWEETEEVEEVDEKPRGKAIEPFLSFDYTPPTPQQPSRKKNEYKYKATQRPESPPDSEEEPETELEFNIQSIEEVKKAIVWSEILNRKY